MAVFMCLKKAEEEEEKKYVDATAFSTLGEFILDCFTGVQDEK